mmetsp:Transcript_23905/g.56742  ORF Transcript_23905/g.56742 Transcript_23905/m.56742 type:complete len:244 (-) Transcript_23905:91-822(-)
MSALTSQLVVGRLQPKREQRHRASSAAQSALASPSLSNTPCLPPARASLASSCAREKPPPTASSHSHASRAKSRVCSEWGSQRNPSCTCASTRSCEPRSVRSAGARSWVSAHAATSIRLPSRAARKQRSSASREQRMCADSAACDAPPRAPEAAAAAADSAGSAPARSTSLSTPRGRPREPAGTGLATTTVCARLERVLSPESAVRRKQPPIARHAATSAGVRQRTSSGGGGARPERARPPAA